MGSEHQIAFFLRELAGRNTQRRVAAAKGLGKVGRREHAWVLAETAGDPVPQVREAAAIGLGRLGVPEAGEKVLPLLMGDMDPWVRRRASLAAIHLGLQGDGIVRAFTKLLDDPEHHVRINALVGLTALGVPGDVPALVSLLGDPDGAVWGRARSLIYELRDDPAVRAEVIRTARHGDGAARIEALTLLPRRCTERLLDSLLSGLRDPSPDVRIAVASRLSGVETPQIREALATALDGEQSPAVAARLLHMLEQPGDQQLIGPARRWLRDPVAGPAAAHALGEVDTGTAVDHLRGVIADTAIPGPTRAAAAKAIGECGRWDAVWLLLPLLDDPDTDVQTGAVDGLGAAVYGGLRLWERRPVTRALIARLTAEPSTAWRTGYALIGLADALPDLRHLADSAEETEVRAAVLPLLVPEDRDGPGQDNYGAEEDVRRLVRGLDDPQEPVRCSAAHALKQWLEVGFAPPPDRDALHERLTALTSDPSPRLRQVVAALLQALADPGGRN
ncbi:HEAT repeat domain-containing protein [Streptomyces sp. ActVer]|uniref:HEAT repeat domain-containing protein n=1 Tax=Streptomyces sp. ActVer TaxID=3014558 RepID=UPI0022B594F7|nr:HEAT repeat domain-containing protein [Streptomyces sp. ActVer]MCZ4512718.1 HEAT repeat domain-containing protein [Streptomyces sp. ActVer]